MGRFQRTHGVLALLAMVTIFYVACGGGGEDPECETTDDCPAGLVCIGEMCVEPEVDAGADSGEDAGEDAGEDVGVDAPAEDAAADTGADTGVEDGGGDAAMDAATDAPTSGTL